MQRERDFTRDASHELRTPLTVIRVATDLMLGDGDVPERSHRSLARIQRAGRDMEAVIDAFLILAREDGIAPQTEDFDVRDVVYEEVGEGAAAARRQARGAARRPSSHRRGCTRRRMCCRCMLGNLLRQRLHLHRGRHDRGAHRAGPGSGARQRHRHVGRHAGDAPTIRSIAPTSSIRTGKGMGLSIVRRLGERFGWPVTLESTPAVGTTATVRFSAEP